MLFIILFILIAIILALVAYAAYLNFRSATSKARFAFVVVAAIAAVVPATILALQQVRIVDLIVAGVRYLQTGKLELLPIDGPLQLANYILVFALSFLTLSALVRFSNHAMEHWEGRTTLVDATLAEKNQRPNIGNVTTTYIHIRTSGQDDYEVDPGTINRQFELSPPPPALDWNRLSRELILALKRELLLPENNWNPEPRSWFGTSDGLACAMMPLSTWSEDSWKGLVDTALAAASGTVRLYLCVEHDAVAIAKSAREHRGVSVFVYGKRELLFGSIDLRDYCRDLIERFYSSDIFVSGHSIESMFVRPTVSEGQNRNVDLLNLIDEWERLDGTAQLSILGQFGQGKSTAVLAYCAAWAARHLENPSATERVPLLIPLRGRDLSALSKQELLAAWGDQYQLSGRALLHLVIGGRATLFFEGFDEVNNAGLRAARFSQFDKLWQFSYPNSKIVLTGRSNFFFDTLELHHLLRLDDPVARATATPSTRILRLQFFGPDEVKLALRSFPQEVVASIATEYEKNPNFRDIASRPSILPLLASIWTSIQEPDGTALTSAKIIDKYVHSEYVRKLKFIESDLVSAGGRRDEAYMRIPLRVKEFIMMCVARDMATSARPNSISNEGLRKTIQSCIRAAELYTRDRDAFPAELDFFAGLRRDEEQDAESAFERLHSEIRTTGLLADDVARGSGYLYFPHRQFYEYYLARFAHVASDAKLARKTEGVFARFLSTSRPCAVLLNEKQAESFFAELAHNQWFESVFTVRSSMELRILISTVGAAVVVFANPLHAFYERMALLKRQADRVALSKAQAYLAISILSILLLSIITYLAVNYTWQTAAALTFISAYGAIAFQVGSSGFAITDLLQWCRLTVQKFGPAAEDIQLRALGPVAYASWVSIVRNGERLGLLSTPDVEALRVAPAAGEVGASHT